MTLRAARQAVAARLAGLAVPSIVGDNGAPLAVVAYAYPEPVDVLAAPTVWVFDATSKEKRASGMRAPAAGRKAVVHALQLALMWQFDVEASDPAQFDDFCEAVMAALRTYPLPATLTDAETGATSDLIRVGEDMELHNQPPQAIVEQGLLQYVSVLLAPLEEWVPG